MGRKYKEEDILKLIANSGGRCNICNADTLTDWRAHTSLKAFQKAHIKSFSDIGPRADTSMTIEKRNSYDNLLLLCPTCHTKIDKKISEGIYTAEWLLNRRKSREQKIKSVFDALNDKECLFIKYISAIGSQNFTLSDDVIINTCFKNQFFSPEKVINFNENNLSEDIEHSKKQIDEKFEKRVQRYIDNNEHKPICIFALAPMPILIFLGQKFHSLLEVHIFTAHRNNTWIYDEKLNNIEFSIKRPDCIDINHKIALAINSTAQYSCETIYKTLGDEVDIWEINASQIGVDLLSSQKELADFYKQCVSALDVIGCIYGKDKIINVFPAMCNSLAITFGRAIFPKCHSIIRIYDTINVNNEKIVAPRLDIC